MFNKIISVIALISISWAFTYAIYDQENTDNRLRDWGITIMTTAVVDNKTELESANSLAKQKIINDRSKEPEKYLLDSHVLRQEIAAVARWVAKLEKKEKCDNIFKDLSDTKPNWWACRNVEVLVDNDLISKNETFRPEDKITKSETIAMLIKAIGFDYKMDPDSNKNWQEQVVEYAIEKKVVEPFTDFNTNATRGWVFQVADTTIRKDIEIKAKKAAEEKKKLEEKKKYTDEAL